LALVGGGAGEAVGDVAGDAGGVEQGSARGAGAGIVSYGISIVSTVAGSTIVHDSKGRHALRASIVGLALRAVANIAGYTVIVVGNIASWTSTSAINNLQSACTLAGVIHNLQSARASLAYIVGCAHSTVLDRAGVASRLIVSKASLACTGAIDNSKIVRTTTMRIIISEYKRISTSLASRNSSTSIAVSNIAHRSTDSAIKHRLIIIITYRTESR
jgi:hypothetical protein